ncbi:MAG: DEAD/DEAH box helicase [Spirochaetes bacterium]|nr:DEAD/DEAH box helicase [Spirochaetota bacterium]MBU0956394.1 DEAD/DEAH box helicase [Spirochaetota bacterium]
MQISEDSNPEQQAVTPVETGLRYDSLNIHPDLARAITEAGYVECMPVQAATFPLAFDGRDIYAQSQTGTGKTAAFLISIFQRMMTIDALRRRKSLIIAPTRELAVQIEGEARKLAKYLPISMGCFYGGVSYNPQESMLRDDVQMIIGTPGRIIDLVQQGKMLLREVGFLVVDEADRMFDMGFIDDLRKLLRYLPPPAERQTFLFSATLNFRIKNLAWEYMANPHEIAIEPDTVTVELVTQELYHVGSDEKLPMLLGILAREKPQGSIIFCNQKFVAEEIARRLGINGVECEYIMGDLPQAKRSQVIERLKAGKIAVLVATDVAARGLDVTGLDLVVNYDLPMDAESYVHRIGRTARAGAAGLAVSLACEKFVYSLPAIEKYLGQKIPVCNVTEELLIEDKSRNLRFSSGYSQNRGRNTSEQRSAARPGPHGVGGRGASRGGSRTGPARGERTGTFSERSPARGQDSAGGRPPRPAQQSQDGRQRNSTSYSGQGQPRRQGSGASTGTGRSPAVTQQNNPYNMSAEERMKRYKEKYATESTGSTAKGSSRSDGERTRKPAGQNRPADKQNRGAGNKKPARPAQNTDPATGKTGNAKAVAKPAGAALPPISTTSSPAKAKKPGLLDRIKSIFKK